MFCSASEAPRKRMLRETFLVNKSKMQKQYWTQKSPRKTGVTKSFKNKKDQQTREKFAQLSDISSIGFSTVDVLNCCCVNEQPLSRV